MKVYAIMKLVIKIVGLKPVMARCLLNIIDMANLASY